MKAIFLLLFPFLINNSAHTPFVKAIQTTRMPISEPTLEPTKVPTQTSRPIPRVISLPPKQVVAIDQPFFIPLPLHQYFSEEVTDLNCTNLPHWISIYIHDQTGEKSLAGIAPNQPKDYILGIVGQSSRGNIAFPLPISVVSEKAIAQNENNEAQNNIFIDEMNYIITALLFVIAVGFFLGWKFTKCAMHCWRG